MFDPFKVEKRKRIGVAVAGLLKLTWGTIYYVDLVTNRPFERFNIDSAVEKGLAMIQGQKTVVAFRHQKSEGGEVFVTIACNEGGRINLRTILGRRIGSTTRIEVTDRKKELAFSDLHIALGGKDKLTV